MANALTRLLGRGDGDATASAGEDVDTEARRLAALATGEAAAADEDEDENAADPDPDEADVAEEEETEDAPEDEPDDQPEEDPEDAPEPEAGEGDGGEGGESGSEAAAAAARDRIAAIQRCDEAKGREALAQTLALDTEVSVEEAKKILAASGAPNRGKLADRMSGVRNPNVGPGGVSGDEETVDQVSDRLAGYVNHGRAA